MCHFEIDVKGKNCQASQSLDKIYSIIYERMTITTLNFGGNVVHKKHYILRT